MGKNRVKTGLKVGAGTKKRHAQRRTGLLLLPFPEKFFILFVSVLYKTPVKCGFIELDFRKSLQICLCVKLQIIFCSCVRLQSLQFLPVLQNCRVCKRSIIKNQGLVLNEKGTSKPSKKNKIFRG